jgi:hypothetical protein
MELGSQDQIVLAGMVEALEAAGFPRIVSRERASAGSDVPAWSSSSTTECTHTRPAATSESRQSAPIGDKLSVRVDDDRHGGHPPRVPAVVLGDFEWDDRKAAMNLRKHGVSFAPSSTRRIFEAGAFA